MTAPTLRDQLAKALRGKYDSTDSRPSYRAADAVLPVVRAALDEREHDAVGTRQDADYWRLRAEQAADLLAEQTQRAEQAERERNDYRDRFTNQMTAATELIEKLRQADARLAELEGALNWQTSCTSCARVLDSAYAETMRAEQAEALAARYRIQIDDPDSVLHELDEAQQSRDWHKRTAAELLADLERAEGAIARVEQMCRTATIPPVAELEARLARRILATIEQLAGGEAAAPTLRQRAEQAEAAVQRVREFAEDMRNWCSPYGVASDYAKRLLEALDRPEGT